MNFKQFPYMDWPQGLCKRIGLLDLQPEEIEKKCGIQFAETSDTFDYMMFAVIELETREQYALVQFRGSKRLGVELWIPESVGNTEDMISLFFANFNISREHLRWKRQDY